MPWQPAADTPPSVRIASLTPSLKPTEGRVVEAIVTDRSGTVERTAQELADHVGVSRTTVIRAAKSLGYEGFPQLRVAIAQELALEHASTTTSNSEDSSLLGALREGVARFGTRLEKSTSALTEETLTACITSLDEANRILVIANGLSNPLGIDLVLRLNSVGRPAEMLLDAMSQQIAARQLGPGSVCLAYSGSGANRSTVDALRAAQAGGAQVIAITSFAQSAVAEIADVRLIIPPINDSFHDELVHTSRASLMLVTEQLIDLLVTYRGDRGHEARMTAMSMLGGSLQE